MHHGRRFYDLAPLFLIGNQSEIEKKIGRIKISDDENEVLLLNPKLNPYRIWVNANIFTNCKTVDQMIIAFAEVAHADRERQSNKDRETAQWNYCIFFLLGSIIAPTVMWYVKT